MMGKMVSGFIKNIELNQKTKDDIEDDSYYIKKDDAINSFKKYEEKLKIVLQKYFSTESRIMLDLGLREPTIGEVYGDS